MHLLLCLCVFALCAAVSHANLLAKSTKLNNKQKYNKVNIVGDARKSEVHKHHGLSLPLLVVNVVADLCPHGMLPLAYGIAQEGGTGVVPAVALLLIFGTMSAYTMTSYADMAVETNSNSIGEIWSKLINKDNVYIADLSVFALCFGCCIFYSAFIGDIFAYLSSALGVTSGIFSKRWALLAIVSSLFLLPLCLLEDLSALQFSSLLGVGGIGLTFFTLLKRSMDGTYSLTSAMTKLLTVKPSWPTPKYSLWNAGKGTLVLANMMCVAYLAHYNSINYYKELTNHTPKRYKIAIGTGFGISCSVFIGMMLLGYSIFGTTAQPLILNNFHRTKDNLATAARFATGLAITFAYPLMFAGLKSSLYNLVDNSNKKIVNQSNVKTAVVKPDNMLLKRAGCVLSLAVITSIAFKCGEEDVSLVLGIVGSVLGCGVAYILPAILRLKHMRNRKASGLTNNKFDVVFNHILAAAGTIFGVLGVLITVEQEAKHHH